MKKETNLLPALVLEGIRLINAGNYFEAHEVLEKEWLVTKGSDRLLFQGLIQYSVACHHIRQANLKGALTCLRNADSKLLPYVGAPYPFDLSNLLEHLRDLEKKLSEMETISNSVATALLLPPIKME